MANSSTPSPLALFLPTIAQDAERLVASLGDVRELLRTHGGEDGLTVEIPLGDTPSVLVLLDRAGARAHGGPDVEQLRDLGMEVKCLRDVDGDLDRLVDHLRVDALVAPERSFLDVLRTHCNSAVIQAPRCIEKVVRDIGLTGQELMRDVRDGFAPDLAPEYIRRAKALKRRIAGLLSPRITIQFRSKSDQSSPSAAPSRTRAP